MKFPSNHILVSRNKLGEKNTISRLSRRKTKNKKAAWNIFCSANGSGQCEKTSRQAWFNSDNRLILFSGQTAKNRPLASKIL